MDPTTGEILALANWPTFNPNIFGRADDRERRNRAIQDLYEPGSTFKIVTASAALEERVIRPRRLVDCAPGYITIGSRKPIHDVHRYGTLSFTDVIVKSSNVGAIKVGLRLGPERLGRYVTRFGFGQTLSPDFRGENPGIVWNPVRLNDSALASMSMGYQVGVTPLQMAAAVSSVANGGIADGAARRPRRHQGRPARSGGAEGAAPDGVADDDRRAANDHGRRRRARHRRDRRRSPATPSPARPAPRPRSSTGTTRSRTTTPRSSASFRRGSRR